MKKVLPLLLAVVTLASEAQPVLLWRGQVGVADPDAEAMVNALLKAVDPDAPWAYGVVPLDAYLDTLAAAVENAATEPRTAAQESPDGEEPRTPR